MWTHKLKGLMESEQYLEALHIKASICSRLMLDLHFIDFSSGSRHKASEETVLTVPFHPVFQTVLAQLEHVGVIITFHGNGAILSKYEYYTKQTATMPFISIINGLLII